jgi:hypothetical protein
MTLTVAYQVGGIAITVIVLGYLAAMAVIRPESAQKAYYARKAARAHRNAHRSAHRHGHRFYVVLRFWIFRWIWW